MNKILFWGILIIPAVLFLAGCGWLGSSNKKTENASVSKTDCFDSKKVPQGLQVEITKQGTGTCSTNGDTLVVHYTGTLTDGTKFDSSLDRAAPFKFKLGQGQVIKGWDTGMLGMKPGEKRKLTIAPELGYGSMGIGTIPPNSTLLFDVELLEIQK